MITLVMPRRAVDSSGEAWILRDYGRPRERTRVIGQTTVPVGPDDYVGIAIKEVDEDQRHVGFVYQMDEGSARLCHLAFHLQLEDEALSRS